MSAVAGYLLSVYGPAGRTEFGTYPSQQAVPQAFADGPDVETKGIEESVRALLEP